MLPHQNVTGDAELSEVLSRPYEEDVAFATSLDGDVIVLGAGGKMGPTLVRRIAWAMEEAGGRHSVYAVSRFSDEEVRREVDATGAKVVSADLMDDEALFALPDCPNVIYLVGMKFGASGKQALTWALNSYLPGRVASRYADSRIVALSTGNVYPKVPVESGGATEDVAPDPVGEYAQSCLGRERVFQHFSLQNGTPICLVRLNYAVEARYGVLLDIATRVYRGEPVGLDTGYVNTVWQGDANSVCFRALGICTSPANILNLTGPEILSVREMAEEFGKRFGVEPRFEGREQQTAFLNDASTCHELFGEPKVSTDDVIDLVAVWLEQGGSTHGKPTKFEVRDGKF